MPLKMYTVLDYWQHYTVFNWKVISLSADLGRDVALCLNVDIPVL